MIQKVALVSAATALVWQCLCCIDRVKAFHLPYPPSCSVMDGIQRNTFAHFSRSVKRKNNLTVQNMSGNDKNDSNNDEYTGDFDFFQDDQNEIGGGNGKTNDNGGDALAQQFYQQLRIREEEKKNREGKEEEEEKQNKKQVPQPKSDGPINENKQQQQQQPDNKSSSSNLSEDELRKRNRKAFLKRKEISVSRQKRRDGNDDNDMQKSSSSLSSPSPSVEAIRFFSASKGVTGSGGNSLFSEPSSSSSRNSNNNARQNMIRQEFNLLRVASSETTLLLQIGLVILLLIFEISIGMNGGITDGSDRFGNEPNDYNGVEEEIMGDILLQQKNEDDVADILKNMSPSSGVGGGLDGSVGGGSVWL